MATRIKHEIGVICFLQIHDRDMGYLLSRQ